MSDHRNIEDLVRSKLGDAEITPSKGAWRGVQRQLRLKQFLRFNPAQFNAWYLGAILVAGTLALTIGSGGPADRVPGDPAPASETGGEMPAERVTEEIKGKKETGDREGAVVGKATTEEALQEEASTEGITVGKLSQEGELKGDQTQNISQTEKSAAEEEKDSKTARHTLVTYFTASDIEGCAPMQVRFFNASVNAVTLSWNFGNGETSTEFEPACTYEEAGTYAVALTAHGVDGEHAIHHQVIRVHPAPVAGFEIEEGLKGLDGLKTMEIMNYSTGGFSYSWEFLSAGEKKETGWSSREFQPTIQTGEIPESAQTMRLVVLSEHGCTDTVKTELPSMAGSLKPKLEFPTVFEANHTGPTGGHYSPHELRVDVFHPHFPEEPGEYRLKVFSRMGEVIFETRDIYHGWDGYYMQERSAGGVYLWVAEGSWQNGSTFSEKGDVTLLWNDRR